MSMQLVDCEHCGSLVTVQKVCSRCSREHSQDWIDRETKNNVVADAIGAIIAVGLLIYWFS